MFDLNDKQMKQLNKDTIEIIEANHKKHKVLGRKKPAWPYSQGWLEIAHSCCLSSLEGQNDLQQNNTFRHYILY